MNKAGNRLPVLIFLLAVLAALVGVPVLSGAPQENDYRIVPGQRMGRYELGKPVETYNLGRPTWQGTHTTARGVPFRDHHVFVAHGVRLDTCRSTGLAIGIFAYRRLDRSEAEVEAAKYRTAEGLAVGVEEAQVLRILGRPHHTSEWTERQGTIDIPLVQYTYPGLLVRVSRTDGKVLAIGVERPGGYSACEGDVVVLQALQGAAQRPFPAIARRVALTPCEAEELRRRLLILA